MEFRYDDGGRAAAGYRGNVGDCVTRAIAITTGRSYADVYRGISELGRQERLGKRKHRKSHARTGVHKATIRRYMEAINAKWVPTMGIGTGCTTHLKKSELPMGRLIVKVSKHCVAVIDGVMHDTYDPSRHGTRCVYGYWVVSDS